jgi:nucleotide-binding universal stress UspA family protein
MRILIGYNGSESADAILDDLVWAGLPEVCDVRVISVAEVPAGSVAAQEAAAPETASVGVGTALSRSEVFNDREISNAREAAEKAADMIGLQFPEWNVDVEVKGGTPALEVIDAAERWNADLVMVGSQDRSALGRLLLGSVSKSIVTDANRSVHVSRRIERKNEKSPPYIIVGVDGSPAAQAAVEEVARRAWPYGTQIRLVAVQDQPDPVNIAARLPRVADIIHESSHEAVTRQNQMIEWATYQLKSIGLTVSLSVQKGDAKRILLKEARKHKADCIFVGTREFKNALERFRLGSVSSAVVTNAHCSVEVVRPQNVDDQ